MADTNPTDIFSGTKDVAESHKFDEAKLAAWMEANVEGWRGARLTVRQFKGGQSNPTYQLITPTKKYVMRRKPPGKLCPSAHAVDREFRVIAALYPLGFPVAKPYGLCEDDSVVGTMFYIMDMVEGRILWDATPPDYTPAQRSAIFDAKVSTFAQLHNVDWKKAGLEGFGKEGDYIARQIHRWTKQYQMSETVKIPEMDKLIEWLPKNIPPGERTIVVHGDYRIDNMVLHPTEPRVLAVLDWELSTLGDPLADFTYHLMSWVMPSSDPQRPSIAVVVDQPGLRHPDERAVRRALLRAHRPHGRARPRLLLRLQRLPSRRHHPGHRRPRPRRHREQRRRRPERRPRGASCAVRLRLRATGGLQG